MNLARPMEIFHAGLLCRRLKTGLAVTQAQQNIGSSIYQLKEKKSSVLLSSHFVSRPEELPVFEKLFNEFWVTGLEGESSAQKPLSGIKLPLEIIGEDRESPPGTRKEARTVHYSPEENLRQKDFGELSEPEAEEIDKIILSLAQNIAISAGAQGASQKRVDFTKTAPIAAPGNCWS
jgi:hypothetical protein